MYAYHVIGNIPEIATSIYATKLVPCERLLRLPIVRKRERTYHLLSNFD